MVKMLIKKLSSEPEESESVTKCKHTSIYTVYIYIYGPVVSGVCGTDGPPDLGHFHFSHSTPVTAAS